MLSPHDCMCFNDMECHGIGGGHGYIQSKTVYQHSVERCVTLLEEYREPLTVDELREGATARPMRGRGGYGRPWRFCLMIPRCLFLMAVTAGLAFMMWKPGWGNRLWMSFYILPPTRAESLGWRPDDGDVFVLPPAILPPMVQEWRPQGSLMPSEVFFRYDYRFVSPDAVEAFLPVGARTGPRRWNWVETVPPRMPKLERENPPPSDLVKMGATHEASNAKTVAVVADAEKTTGPATEERKTDEVKRDELSASMAEMVIPALPPLPAVAELSSDAKSASASPETKAVDAIPAAPLAEQATVNPESQEVTDKATPAVTSGVLESTDSSAAVGLGVGNDIGAGKSEEMTPVVRSDDVVATEASIVKTIGAEQPAAAKASSVAPGSPDWRKTNITGTIPGAYLMVYPKLKFIGLCVPGQGYVRKYYQVGVPENLGDPKQAADDGRSPYGKYYIADRSRDSDGARLFISWPSPEDGKRIGLPEPQTREIDSAWKSRSLPPQDTQAGGGVAIFGVHQLVEKTEGGFSMDDAQMDELYRALPDGAWVIIQQ